MRNVWLFLRDLPFPMIFGFTFGAIAGACVGTFTADNIEAQIQRDETIQQQCIDGNNNACRVMELRS